MKNNQFDNNKYNELLSIFNHNEKQSNVFMTNEYFEILPKLFTDENKWKFTTFSYAYLYLNTYMYRWSTYGQYIPKVNEIKEILGLYGNDKRYNDVIKKDGILDAYGLTETVGVKDIPILNTVDEFEGLKFDFVSDIFPDSKCEIFKEWKNAKCITPKTTIKKPVLALHSNIKNDDFMGTFYNPNNFTNIPFEVFAFCMSKKELGVAGFFIYAYIKNGMETYKEEFKTSHRMIANKFGGAYTTIYDSLVALIKHGLVERFLGQEEFSKAMPLEERQASIYTVLECAELFNKEGNVDYEKASVLTVEEYKEINKKEEKLENNIDKLTLDEIAELLVQRHTDPKKKRAEIDLDQLPF